MQMHDQNTDCMTLSAAGMRRIHDIEYVVLLTEISIISNIISQRGSMSRYIINQLISDSCYLFKLDM